MSDLNKLFQINYLLRSDMKTCIIETMTEKYDSLTVNCSRARFPACARISISERGNNALPLHFKMASGLPC